MLKKVVKHSNTKIKKTFKIVISFLLVFVLYWGISVIIGITDANGHHHFYYSNYIDKATSIEVAKTKNILITNSKIKKEILFDSLGIFNNLDFWLSKLVVHNDYGFLPLFHFSDTSKNACQLNIKSNLPKSIIEDQDLCFSELPEKISAKGGGFRYSKYTNLWYNLPTDTVVLVFKQHQINDVYKEIGVIKLFW